MDEETEAARNGTIVLPYGIRKLLVNRLCAVNVLVFELSSARIRSSGN